MSQIKEHGPQPVKIVEPVKIDCRSTDSGLESLDPLSYWQGEVSPVAESQGAPESALVIVVFFVFFPLGS